MNTDFTYEAGADKTAARKLVITIPGSGAIDVITFCSGTNLLPVELTQFDATLDGETALLRWATASETNNAGFEVQHQAPETAEFETLTFVEGHGTTELPKQYAQRVEGLAPGPHQFRLRQVDFDGAFEFSPTVEVYVGLPDTYVVDPVYPNPFNPQATLRFGVQQAQQVTVDLYDITGRQVDVLYQGTLSDGQFETVTIDGSDLSSGVYLVRVQGETFVETQNVTLMK
ncbi:MAG: T9SS type A sorting domain-containing protein [Bacteroidetes bacterium]|nr:T9SS type A sorting domain-containing protein [Bacteroidota bacterium]